MALVLNQLVDAILQGVPGHGLGLGPQGLLLRLDITDAAHDQFEEVLELRFHSPSGCEPAYFGEYCVGGLRDEDRLGSRRNANAVIRVQDEQGFLPVDLRDEKALGTAGFLGRQKLFVHTL
jgi:hypothetical protein